MHTRPGEYAYWWPKQLVGTNSTGGHSVLHVTGQSHQESPSLEEGREGYQVLPAYDFQLLSRFWSVLLISIFHFLFRCHPVPATMAFRLRCDDIFKVSFLSLRTLWRANWACLLYFKAPLSFEYKKAVIVTETQKKAFWPLPRTPTRHLTLRFWNSKNHSAVITVRAHVL